MKPTLRRPLIVAGVVWVAVMVAPPLALWQARDRWMERLERPEAQAAWDAFRRDMAEQTGRDGPVQRKVPKSPEPPLRVWLRDYFGLAVVAWLSFAGVAGILLLILLWGSIVNPSSGFERRGLEPPVDEGAMDRSPVARAASPPSGEPRAAGGVAGDRSRSR